jgi:hypothetical protein
MKWNSDPSAGQPVASRFTECAAVARPFIGLTKKKFVALSPQAKYTDRATVTCRLNLVPTFVDRGVSRGQRGGSLTVVNLSFLDRSRYVSFK